MPVMDLQRLGSLSIPIAVLLAVSACSRSREAPSIGPEPARTVSVTPVAVRAEAPAPAPVAPPKNPLAMPLKHDDPGSLGIEVTVRDACAPHEERGRLGMPLKHDRVFGENPLCMRLK